MLEGQQDFVHAVFSDERTAKAAVQKLIDADFATERLGALALDDTGVSAVPLQHKTGVGKGALIGTLLGATAGVVALPALGLVAGGAFALFEAAATGGAAGTLAGILGGLGLWKDEFAFPRTAFEQGAVLIGVLCAHEQAPTARAALIAAGGQNATVSSWRAAQQELDERARHARAP